MKEQNGFSQVYGKGFARAYNRHWAFFSERLAPTLEALFAGDPPMSGAPRTLLDVCCGTGQLARHFLAKAYSVTGIDLSPSMLEYARRNNRGAVEEGRARFIEADAASFATGERFSFAVSLFDALNHLHDLAVLASCFRCVSQSLRIPGMFVFDLNTRAAFQRWNEITVQESEELTLIERGIYIEGADHAYTSISGFLRNRDGSYDRFVQRVYETAFETEEVLEALRRAGFSGCYVAAGSNLAVPAEATVALRRAFFICHKRSA